MLKNTLLFHIKKPYLINSQTPNLFMQVYLYQFNKANDYLYGDYVYFFVCFILIPIASVTLQTNGMQKAVSLSIVCGGPKKGLVILC